MFLILLIFALIFSPSIGEKAPVCKSVNQYGFFTKTSESYSNALVKFNFDMSVTFNPNNPSSPNTLVIKNFTFSDLQEPDNSSSSNITFNNLSFTFFGNPHKIFDCLWHSIKSKVIFSHCLSITYNCTFEFPNGEIIYFFNYNNNGSQNIANGPYLYVNDGTFFNGKNVELWKPSTNLTCNNYVTIYGDLNFYYFICCTSFEDIQIPDSNNDTCQNFETITTIFDPSSTSKPISITAHYSLMPSNNSLQVNIAALDSPDPAYIYYAYVGYPFTSFINGSSNMKNTTFSLNLSNEKQYEILFDYNPSATDAGDGIFKYGGVSLGEIIMRNGMFLKNVNQLYTSENPCWTKVAAVPFTNATYNSSFCCTNFMSQQTTSLPFSTTTTFNNTNDFRVIRFLMLCLLLSLYF